MSFGEISKRKLNMEQRQSRERIPKILAARCLGEQCPNFSGEVCEPYLDLLNADGEGGGADRPPFADTGTYATYGLVCKDDAGQECLVGLHTELKPEANITGVIARAAAWGDLPHSIVKDSEEVAIVQTLASSEDND